MTKKRFTNIEHDYENAWIKCNDDGDFMIYSIYKELAESLPSLENLLNGLSEENEQLEEAREYYQENFLRMKTERNQFKRENELLKFQLDECRNNKLFSRRELEKENEELKQRINNRLHYYRELYNHFDKNDGFSYNIVERVVEDLEDILR